MCIEPEGLMSKHSAWLYLLRRSHAHTSFETKCYNATIIRDHPGLSMCTIDHTSRVTINEVLKAFRIHRGRFHRFFLLHTSKIDNAQNAQDMKSVPPKTWNCRSWLSFLPQHGKPRGYHTGSIGPCLVYSIAEADAVQSNLWPNSPPLKRTASQLTVKYGRHSKGSYANSKNIQHKQLALMIRSMDSLVICGSKAATWQCEKHFPTADQTGLRTFDCIQPWTILKTWTIFYMCTYDNRTDTSACLFSTHWPAKYSTIWNWPCIVPKKCKYSFLLCYFNSWGIYNQIIYGSPFCKASFSTAGAWDAPLQPQSMSVGELTNKQKNPTACSALRFGTDAGAALDMVRKSQYADFGASNNSHKGQIDAKCFWLVRYDRYERNTENIVDNFCASWKCLPTNIWIHATTFAMNPSEYYSGTSTKKKHTKIETFVVEKIVDKHRST